VDDELSNRNNALPTSIIESWSSPSAPQSRVLLSALHTYLEPQLKLRKAGQDEFKKNRHFYPLLVHFGVEALSDADAEEIQVRLTELSEE